MCGAAGAGRRRRRGTGTGPWPRPAAQLRIGVTIKAKAGGGYEGSLESPDQTAKSSPSTGQGRGRRAELFDQRHRGRLRWQVGPGAEGLGRPVAPGRRLAARAHRRQARRAAALPVVAGVDGDWATDITTANGARSTSSCTCAPTPAAPRQPGSAGPAGLRHSDPPVRPRGPDGAVHLPAAGRDLRGRARRRRQVHRRNLDRRRLQGPAHLHLAPDADRRAERPQTPKPPFPYRAEEVTCDERPGREAGRHAHPAAGQGPVPRRGDDHRLRRPGPRRDDPWPQAVRRDRRPR